MHTRAFFGFRSRAGLPLGDGLGHLGGRLWRLVGVQTDERHGGGAAPGVEEQLGAWRWGRADAARMTEGDAGEQPGVSCCELAHHGHDHGHGIRMAVMGHVCGGFKSR